MVDKAAELWVELLVVDKAAENQQQLNSGYTNGRLVQSQPTKTWVSQLPNSLTSLVMECEQPSTQGHP